MSGRKTGREPSVDNQEKENFVMVVQLRECSESNVGNAGGITGGVKYRSCLRWIMLTTR